MLNNNLYVFIFVYYITLGTSRDLIFAYCVGSKPGNYD